MEKDYLAILERFQFNSEEMYVYYMTNLRVYFDVYIGGTQTCAMILHTTFVRGEIPSRETTVILLKAYWNTLRVLPLPEGVLEEEIPKYLMMMELMK